MANQGFYLPGLDNTSPTFASAIQNSVPAITFLMEVILVIEHHGSHTHNYRTSEVEQKGWNREVAGTLFCVLGAFVITFYKDSAIYSPVPPLHNHNLIE
ncbi:protein WALLS ARE THIN [Trifolium repens]|nr:protein WALLS ARE THIN [Trifolium repens]